MAASAEKYFAKWIFTPHKFLPDIQQAHGKISPLRIVQIGSRAAAPLQWMGPR